MTHYSYFGRIVSLVLATRSCVPPWLATMGAVESFGATIGSKDEFVYEWLLVRLAGSTGPGTLETETAKLWRDRGSGRELSTPS